MLQAVLKQGAGVLVLALAASGAGAAELSDMEAARQAASQRTLVMRVAKAHVQLAVGEDQANARKTLANGIEQYDKSLQALQAGVTEPALQQRLQQMAQSWQTFKMTAQAVPTRASVETLLVSSDNLLYQTDTLMRQWQLRLSQEQFNDQAYQQSMLSERIGLFQGAQHYGMQEDWVQQELNASLQAYENGLAALPTGLAANLGGE